MKGFLKIPTHIEQGTSINVDLRECNAIEDIRRLTEVLKQFKDVNEFKFMLGNGETYAKT